MIDELIMVIENEEDSDEDSDEDWPDTNPDFSSPKRDNNDDDDLPF